MQPISMMQTLVSRWSGATMNHEVTSELEQKKLELQAIKKELRLVNHQLITGANRLRDRRRNIKIRTRPNHPILRPSIPESLPQSHSSNNADLVPARLAGTKAGLIWSSLLRRGNAKWETKLSKNATVTDSCDRILLDRKLAVRQNGNKLVPISGSRPLPQEELFWNNWEYAACPNGDFIRTGEWTGEKDQCRYFTRQGFCIKANDCPFEHDMDKIMICKQYLADRCDRECVFSHSPNAHNTPICRYAFQDVCHNKTCRYSHVLPKHSKDRKYEIWTCRPFALGGWCARGHSCPFAHLFNCPDYEEISTCPRGNSCLLQHTITRRIQKLMATTPEEEGVLCTGDNEPEKIIISSFTVDPNTLLGTASDGKKEFVLDLDLSEDELDASVSCVAGVGKRSP